MSFPNNKKLDMTVDDFVANEIKNRFQDEKQNYQEN